MLMSDIWLKRPLEGVISEVEFDVTYSRRSGKNKNDPEHDEVTLTRQQMERLLAEAGYTLKRP